jgi:hypothetical protein
MAEKFKYGPLIWNSFGENDESGNYWWSGSPPVAYEEPSGPYRIPVDEAGNQCLPGECILHPNCRVEDWETDTIISNVPSLSWCMEWFEDNFLLVSEYQVCKYIIRWYDWNNKGKSEWVDYSKNKTIDEMIGEIWPDVQI